MSYSNQFFDAIGIKVDQKQSLNQFSKRCGVPTKRLKHYNHSNTLPTGNDLIAVIKTANISENFLKIKMGVIDRNLLRKIQEKAESITEELEVIENKREAKKKSTPSFKTNLGEVYQEDCLDFLKEVESDSVDLVFADPPFNLSKIYPSSIDDNIKTDKYIEWCESWIYECSRVLKHGGSFFLWNLPKWNSILTSYINGHLTFRNWIGVDIKYSLPIQKRLYPAHYSLIYYVKGEKPKTFHPDRLPMQVCPKCFSELKDYGGYKDKMNPLGINLTDIWSDIPPVRHTKYKRRAGANELSLKLMDRIIEMSSDEGDLVLDPFGGSGTTFMAAELKNRRWSGCEIGPIDDIKHRFEKIREEQELLDSYRTKLNVLFPESIEKNRKKRGLWTPESLRNAQQKNLFE